MRAYIIKRLISSFPLLIGITIISYAVMALAPGDPTSILMDPKVKPEDMERIKHNLGLDKPWYVQYFFWFSRLCRGDFGNSFIDGRPVLIIVLERIPNTLLLMSSSFFLILILAIPIGIFQSIRQYSLLDYILTVISFIGISLPNFWLGLMLILLFALKLGWLPSGGMYSLDFGFSLLDRIKHLILPAITLSVGGIASWSRYQRSSMLEVLRQDYIRTARAKGLKERVVIYKHALRNALIPIITLLGLSLPDLFGGAYITEIIFAWPGMGRLGVQAVFQRDYPVIMGTLLISSILIILGNLLADVIYAYVDPRIRYEKQD